MIIDKNKTYKTVGHGFEVVIYAIYSKDASDRYRVHGAYKEHGKWDVSSWTIEGRVSYSGTDPYDLVEAKPRIKRSVWLNIYDDNTLALHCSLFHAKKYAFSKLLARVKVDIDYMEGDGLE